MKTKDNFLEGSKVTKDNQIVGTPNSKSKNGTGDSPNDNVGKDKSKRNRWACGQEFLGCLFIHRCIHYVLKGLA